MRFLLIILLLSSVAFARTTVNAYGECTDFNVVITTDLEGCYDVKLDTPGSILDGSEWKSTFFMLVMRCATGQQC